MTEYYTHGSIANVSFKDDAVKLHINPINGFEAKVNQERYVVFVDSLEIPFGCILKNTNDGFAHQIDEKKNLYLASILPFWMNKKTKLKITVSQDSQYTSKLTITSIEPIL
ncbi:MAG TPA: hypothetical protein GX525_03570 [Bacilli bacterium]|nr:hypothetical protein [Bacilli bacterium]